MRLKIIPTPKFVPISIKEFERRAQESDFLEAIQIEHYQIVAKPHFGSFEHFSKQENFSKNRYDDIICWDKTHVKITPKKEDTDYIHANYVDSFEMPKKYVATQGPLEKTVNQFWQLIREQNSRIIVMLTELKNAGKENCARYWYPYDDKHQIFQAESFPLNRKQSSKMAACFPSKNINDFLRFMDEPNSQARVIEEYNAIVSKQEEERRHRLNKKLEINGCFSNLKFPRQCPRSKNLVIPSFVDGYETKRKFICAKNPEKKDCEMF
ncbi:unnamed protein product [Colias eurytheme]|nr:unnamed protein product [Colias eurytheme]